MTPPPGPLALRIDRWFYTVMALLIAATVFTGFAATFYLRDAAMPPLKPLLAAHGLIFSSWIVLFIVQAWLVAGNRVEIHKRLGWFGAALALLMVGVGLVAAVDAMRNGRAPIPGLDPRSFFAVPFFDLVVFAALITAGVLKRGSADAHRRIMLIATISVIDAAVARIPLDFIRNGGPPVFFGLTDLFIFIGWGYDLATRRKIHPAFLWSGLVLILSQPFRLMISGTAAWKAFADLFLP